MNKKTVTIFTLAMLGALQASAQQKTPLYYWFDTPVTLKGQQIWYGGHPEKWTNKKPISAGDTARNPDPDWESKSLPIGNGSIGANILGSVEAERITLNEKTLWRGGPNTKKGAAYYWNVNKNSAHVMQESEMPSLPTIGKRHPSSPARTSTVLCHTSLMQKIHSVSVALPRWVRRISRQD